MQQLLNRLKALEEKQKPSVHPMKKSIVQYAFRQLADFDKYRAMEMAESLRNVALQVKDKKADYYASVYAILQERISKPTEQFKNYVLSLLGDRDKEKIMEAVNKVDKSYTKRMSGARHSSDCRPPPPPPPPNHRYAFPNPPVYHPGAPDPSPQLHYMQPTFPHFPQYSVGVPAGPATRRGRRISRIKNKNIQIDVSLATIVCGFLFI